MTAETLREDRIQELLQRLAITRSYAAYEPLKTTLLMVMEDENRLRRITGLYVQVAALYGTTPEALQRNFRTLTEVCWREERKSLCRMARRELSGRPHPGELIELLSTCLIRWEQERAL